MESKYEAVERAVIRRRRRLNTRRGLRQGLSLSAGGTLLYFIGVYTGLLPMLAPWWLWIGLIGLGAWLGAQWGKRLPIALQRELYRVDRALGLDEVLTTIYELRHSTGGSRLLELLYRKFERLSPAIEVERALPLPPEECRGWVRSGGLTAIALAFLLLWLVGVPPLSLDRLLPGSPWAQASTEQTGRKDSPGPRRTPSVDEETQTSDDLASLPEEEAKPDPSQEDCNRGGSGTSRLAVDQTASGPCRGSAGEASTDPQAPEDAAVNGEEQAQREALQRLAQRLSGLLDGLRREVLSPEEARRRLQDLADRAPSDSLREALERAAQAAKTEQMREEIEKALDQIREQLGGQESANSDPQQPSKASEDSTEGQAENSGTPASRRPGEPGESQQSSDPQGDSEKGSNGSSEPGDKGQASSEKSGSGSSSQSESDGQKSAQSAESGAQGDESGKSGEGDESTSGASSQGSQSDGSSTTSADAQSPGESNSSASQDTGTSEEGGESSSEQRSDSPQEGSAKEQPGSESQASGDAPGLEPGQDRPESPNGDELPLNQELFIQGGMIPFDAGLLDRLIVPGLPVDVAGPGPNGAPRLRLDLRRVEALLELRDLPPELRGLVREYFLALAEEGSP